MSWSGLEKGIFVVIKGRPLFRGKYEKCSGLGSAEHRESFRQLR